MSCRYADYVVKIFILLFILQPFQSFFFTQNFNPAFIFIRCEKICSLIWINHFSLFFVLLAKGYKYSSLWSFLPEIKNLLYVIKSPYTHQKGSLWTLVYAGHQKTLNRLEIRGPYLKIWCWTHLKGMLWCIHPVKGICWGSIFWWFWNNKSDRSPKGEK